MGIWNEISEAFGLVDDGKEERDWSLNVARLVNEIDEMCEEYLIKPGADALEFEVQASKTQYMVEAIEDDYLKSKYIIRKTGETIYEARERFFEI